MTSFAADAVPPARLARWQAAYDGADAAAFALPVPNTFLPSDFALRHERKKDGAAAAAAAAGAPRPAARAAERLAGARSPQA